MRVPASRSAALPFELRRAAGRVYGRGPDGEAIPPVNFLSLRHAFSPRSALVLVCCALICAPMVAVPALQASLPAESERVAPRVANNAIPLGDWTPMGISDDSGPAWLDPGLNQAVYALAKYRGQIYAGGLFDDTGGGGDTPSECDDGTIFPMQCIAVWSEDDTAWRPVGAGFKSTVDSLAVMDDTLYAGGLFDDTVGGVGDIDNTCEGNDTRSGVLWTSQSAASDDSWSSVTWGNPEIVPSTSVPVLVAVASGGDDTRVMTSPDGVSWSSPSSPVPVNDWQSGAGGAMARLSRLPQLGPARRS